MNEDRLRELHKPNTMLYAYYFYYEIFLLDDLFIPAYHAVWCIILLCLSSMIIIVHDFRLGKFQGINLYGPIHRNKSFYISTFVDLFQLHFCCLIMKSTTGEGIQWYFNLPIPFLLNKICLNLVQHYLTLEVVKGKVFLPLQSDDIFK